MIKLLKRFLHNTGGSPAIEMALVLPFFVMVFLTAVDLGRLILAHQKVGKAAFVVGSTVSRLGSMERTAINNIITQTDSILTPFSSAYASIVVTAVNNIESSGGADLIIWSHGARGASGTTTCNTVGTTGSADFTTTSPGFTLSTDEAAFVVQICYAFETLFVPSQLLAADTTGQIAKYAIVRYRMSTDIPALL